jgi:hypothetical protein
MRLHLLAALFGLIALPAAGSASDLTTVGRDVVISRPLSGRILAVASDVRIEAPVTGDVVLWGGEVSFGPGALVEGNVRVFFGRVIGGSATGYPVRGEVSTPGTLLSLYLAELRRAPWSGEASSVPVYGLRLLALAAWLGVALLLLYFLSSRLSRAAAVADGDFGGTLLAGALGVVTLFLAVAAALGLLPSAVAIPISILLAAIAVGAKVFGMAVLFQLLGQRLLRDVSPGRRPAALAAGFSLLAAVSLVPVIGALFWSAASVVAVGASFLSRFGAPRYRVAIPRFA